MKSKHRIYLYGNQFLDNTMPDTKQKAIIPTNIQIECKLCSKFVSDYLRIVDLYDVYYGIDRVRGYCCYNCVDGFTPNKAVALIDKDGKRYYPQLVGLGLPLDNYGNVIDNTRSRIDEINKYRKGVDNMKRIARKHGLIPKRKSKSNSISKDNGIDPIMYLANEIYKEMSNNE